MKTFNITYFYGNKVVTKRQIDSESAKTAMRVARIPTKMRYDRIEIALDGFVVIEWGKAA